MNPGQEQFFNFILERADDGKEETAKALLNECFERQNAGTFTPEFLADCIPKILATLKPGAITEVKTIMENFGSGHVSK